MIGPVKIVMFDLDGTLINAYPAVSETFNFTMQKLGLPGQDDLTIQRAVGWGIRDLLSRFVPEELMEKAESLYREHHRESLKRGSSLLPGAGETLVDLKEKGYQCAVASNRPSEFSDIVIRHLEIKKFFDYVVCQDEVERGKPHPDILFKILEMSGFAPDEAVYVGDMTIDAQAGKAAKIRSVIVTTGSCYESEIKEETPFAIIKNIKELIKIINNRRDRF